MFFFFECCVLSCRGLCDELITRPEESYWMYRVVYDQKPQEWGGHGQRWAAAPPGGGGEVRRTTCYLDLWKLFLFVVRNLYPFLVWTLLPSYCKCIGLLLHLITLNHTHTHTHTHTIGLLWTRDQPDAETSTWQQTTYRRDRHACPGRNSNPQSQQAWGPKTYALDRAATGIGYLWEIRNINAPFGQSVELFCCQTRADTVTALLERVKQSAGLNTSSYSVSVVTGLRWCLEMFDIKVLSRYWWKQHVSKPQVYLFNSALSLYLWRQTYRRRVISNLSQLRWN